MNDEYKSFLQCLDDDELLSHISSLSQSQQDIENVDDLQGTKVDGHTLLSNTDPFDDSFNEWILNGNTIGTNNNDISDKGKNKHNSNDNIHDDDNDISSDTETDEDIIGPVHGFGEYGVYFENKLKKQQQRDEEYKQWDIKRREIQNEDVYKEPIFKDCIIFVNGHTVPSMNEIHRLVIIHGGKFLSYLNNKSAATHIVCDRLTPRKQLQYKNCKVVKANWISDCVTAKKLLDWKQYRLFKDIEYNQQQLEFEAKNQQQEYQDVSFANEQFYMDEIEDDESDNLTREDSMSAVEPPNIKLDLKQDRLDNGNNDYVKLATMDAKHPQFLTHFFAKSRLHHLSVWKADLKASFLKRILDNKAKGKYRQYHQTHKTIVHVDFDCFFVSASCQSSPYDIEKHPLAVSHGNNTSDIASCNYVAREFGIKNGMWVKTAKQLCPQLIVLNYDFDLYEKYASALYNYLLSKSSLIDIIYPVLIDEALLDMSSFVGDIKQFCNQLRQDLFQLTKCTISVGVSRNVLLAKLALRKAKPNGYYHLDKSVQDYLLSVSIKDLPGVGYAIVEKIQKELAIESPTINDIIPIPKETLVNIFGPKTSEKLYNYCRGKDNFALDLESVMRKSVSVDVNYGIRFEIFQQVEEFMTRIAKEVSDRLVKLGYVGSSITLRLAKRLPDAPIAPPKHLGMGKCDIFSKSGHLGIPTNDPGMISSELKSLTRSLGIPPLELRGVAVTISKLEDMDQYNKKRQSKLPMNTLKRIRDHKLNPYQDTSEFKDPFEGDIDWAVFNTLPWEIKRELKLELIRRGLVDNTSPQKGKVYLQQLLPTANTPQPEYRRVIIARKGKKSRTSSPRKHVEVSPYKSLSSQDLAYDTSVLNDLPSSIRREVIDELNDYKRQKVEPQTLKQKFIQAVEQKQVANQPITNRWLNNEPKHKSSLLFLNKHYYYNDMVSMLKTWIRLSLDQGGPHLEDISVYFEYFRELLRANNFGRCVRLIDIIRKELIYHRRLETGDGIEFMAALNEWNHIVVDLTKLVSRYTTDHKFCIADI